MNPLGELGKKIEQLCELRKGVSPEKWQLLLDTQVEIASRPANAYGEATKAFLAVLEARKVEQGDVKVAMDAFSQGIATVKATQDDERITPAELVQLAAEFASEPSDPVAPGPGNEGGQALAITGANPADDGSEASRSVASGRAAGPDGELAHLRQSGGRQKLRFGRNGVS